MHFAFLIDPLASLKPKKDSSLALMVEAARREHRVSIFEYGDVTLEKGALFAKATELQVGPEVLKAERAESGVRSLGPAQRVPMETFERVFIRKDPPFDTAYLALTYLLDRPDQGRRFVNAPAGIRQVNEKLYATRYAAYTPETLVTWNLEAALGFAQNYERVVLKPSFLGSGQGVELTSAGAADFEAIFRGVLAMNEGGPAIVQQYLTEGRAGDVRVMLIDGTPLAAVGRRPPPGDFRANIAVGGEAFAVGLSSEQARIASELGHDLRELGIVFAGLDFIGDKLIEINVTSPTLIQELRRVSGLDMASRILDVIEGGL